MFDLGKQNVIILSDRPDLGLSAGDEVEASCWIGMDAFQPCAEIMVDGTLRGLGRMDYGAPWRFASARLHEQYHIHYEQGLATRADHEFEMRD